MNFLLKSSQINNNIQASLIHSDQAEKLIPLLKIQIHTCNEMVTGPCEENIQIFNDTEISHLASILGRLIDDISSPVYPLQQLIITFLMSMCEGSDPEV